MWLNSLIFVARIISMPSAMYIAYDQGPEFIRHDFQSMLDEFNIINDCPTTVKNPQANAIYERLHQSISSALRPLQYYMPIHLRMLMIMLHSSSTWLSAPPLIRHEPPFIPH
jgi:transposase InsO family protein